MKSNCEEKVSVYNTYPHKARKSERKVQGVPQSQAAALPRHQEKDETDKNKFQISTDMTREAQQLTTSNRRTHQLI